MLRIPPRTAAECDALAAAHERRAGALPPGGEAREEYRGFLIARAAILRGTASALRQDAPR